MKIRDDFEGLGKIEEGRESEILEKKGRRGTYNNRRIFFWRLSDH